MSKAIESARNIGPVTGAALRRVGVSTTAALQQMGWEEAWLRLCQSNPGYGYMHLLCGYALLGAIEDLDWLRLPEERKLEVKRVKREIQRDLRNRA